MLLRNSHNVRLLMQFAFFRKNMQTHSLVLTYTWHMGRNRILLVEIVSWVVDRDEIVREVRSYF